MRSPAPFAFGSALSRAADSARAAEEAARTALAELGGGAGGSSPPDLALLFASSAHAGALPDLPALVRQRTGARHLVGCTASGVIGGGAECEEEPALSLWLGRLPEVSVRPFLLAGQSSPDEPAVDLWRRQLRLDEVADPALVVLFADPYSIDPVAVLGTVDAARPGTPVVGGLASGEADGGRLFVQDLAEPRGAAGLVLSGPALRFRTIVSQGCRPVGRHMVITRGHEHVIHEIGSKPALQAFRDVLEDLPERDKQLAARSLHIGRAIDEHKPRFGRGDFLIRNPIGADFDNGSVMIGDAVRAGQTIQLHVRDADTAEEDLRVLLDDARASLADPRGVLLFSCNGRGRHLFGEEAHDSRVIREALGALPIGGFFCAGELGPVGGRNFVHGYTSTVVVFEGEAP